MKNILLLFLLLLCMTVEADTIRKQNYFPKGRELVCRNGQNRYTRALYGTSAPFRLETSDRPVFATFKKGECRNLSLFVCLDGTFVPLDSDSFDCTASYVGGRRTYELYRDELRIRITALASFKEDEDAIWEFKVSEFSDNITFKAVLSETVSSKFQRNGDLGVDDLSKFEAKQGVEPLAVVSWNGLGTSYLLLEKNSSLSAASDDNSDIPTAHTSGAKHKRDFSICKNNENAFRLLKERFIEEERLRDSMMSKVEINTPDALVNTLGSVLVAAADGLWDGKTWQHGCIGWRTPLAGWRGCYVGDAVGFFDRSYKHYQAYAKSQVTNVNPVFPHPSQDRKQNLARAEKRWGTQMYSNGYICRYPERNDVMHHYDMNLNYIDGLLWHLSYDADKQKLKEFWPVLKRHLEWEKRNFDPDNDHLYDAYCCIWASDALYYNGGAVTHSSAYNYRANHLAARIAEIIGEDPKPYREEAEAILKAMNSRLWMPNRGHWAEYQDLMGLKRLHKSAALWSVYTPIDCGACSPEQAFLATKYVDNCIPHIPVRTEDFEGFTLSTTDWMPYAWSTNNVAHEEVANMALAYFQAGRSDMGFKLLKSDLTDEMLLGKSPGNFGQISFYDRERNEAYRDFGDNIGITSRAIINGLFGISPDALNGRCIIKAAFPKEWTSASIRTPYLSYSFERKGDKDIYRIKQNFPQKLKIIVRTVVEGGEYIDSEEDSHAEIEVQTCEGTFTETDNFQRIDGEVQTIVVDRKKLPSPKNYFVCDYSQQDVYSQEYIEKMGLGKLCPDETSEYEMLDISELYNSNISDIFNTEYLSPRPPYTTLQIPVNGVGEWCHPRMDVEINDSGFRNSLLPLSDSERKSLTKMKGWKFNADKKNIQNTSITSKKSPSHEIMSLGVFDSKHGVRFLCAKTGRNVAFTSLWDNYPSEVRTSFRKPKKGYVAACLLMAGSTNNMQSRIDNGIVVAEYSDGSSDTLRLENPINWPPINEEYVFDGKAFWSAPVQPLRFRFDNGKVARDINNPSVLPSLPKKDSNEEKKIGSENRYAIQNGAGVILRMPLNPQKKLKSFRLASLSNDIVIGLMAITLEKQKH